MEKEKSIKGEVLRLIPEAIGYTTTLGLEITRASLVNPKIAPSKVIAGEKPATLDSSSPLFNILQNSGDFYDGYWLSLATYNSLEVIDYLQHKVTNKYIPQRVKSCLTLLAAIGVVTLTEAGILNGGTPDLNDIPAGVVGALFYQGVNYLGRKFSESALSKNIF